MSFKYILALAAHFVQGSGTICAILVEGIMRNDSVMSSLNFNQWFKRRCRLKDFYLEL